MRTRKTGKTVRSWWIPAVVAAVGALATPASAGAGLLFTDEASSCDPTVRQEFAAWGDTAYYRLAPGGSFEGASTWTLSRGAKLVNGNEPFNLRPGSRSLSLPAGAVATSPTMCFSFGDWHARLVVRNTGALGAQLRVNIVVRNLLGLLSVVDGGSLTANGVWAPSPRIGALVSNVGALLGTSRAVSIQLRASGTGASFQVDDVFLDPLRHN